MDGQHPELLSDRVDVLGPLKGFPFRESRGRLHPLKPREEQKGPRKDARNRKRSDEEVDGPGKFRKR